MRLIDADALMHSHCVECTLYQKTCDGEHREKCDWDCILHIEEAPTVDAVPVVRCRDCAHYETAGCKKGYGWCNARVVDNIGVDDDYFCADGEREKQ